MTNSPCLFALRAQRKNGKKKPAQRAAIIPNLALSVPVEAAGRPLRLGFFLLT